MKSINKNNNNVSSQAKNQIWSFLHIRTISVLNFIYKKIKIKGKTRK